MYLSFYNMREFPFSMGCDDRFFYESAVHAEALANMLYTLQQRKGMVLVSGEVGAGKTFMGQLLLSRLGPSWQTVLVRNPPQSGKQLLRALAQGLGVAVDPQADKLSVLEELESHLQRLWQRGRLVALILDECQDLNTSSLEEIRLLWNWEASGQRLLQILLIGQPELRQRLAEPKWESLRQRIVLSYHLGRLGRQDTRQYILHRLRVAGGEGNGGAGAPEFTPEAFEAIYAATSGIPRLINVLCDNALLVGYAREQRRIDPDVVAEVLREMTCWNLRPPAALAEAPAGQGGSRHGSPA